VGLLGCYIERIEIAGCEATVAEAGVGAWFKKEIEIGPQVVRGKEK
jgi:hypothetical protein